MSNTLVKDNTQLEHDCEAGLSQVSFPDFILFFFCGGDLRFKNSSFPPSQNRNNF